MGEWGKLRGSEICRAGRIISVLAAAILCWCWSCTAEAALVAGEECREAGCTLAERCLAGGGNHLTQLRERCTLLLMPMKMPFSAPRLLFSSCLVVFLFLSEMSTDPLVFSEKIKSVLYTHSLRFIKINQQINLDFFFFFFLNLCIK